ncbi:MAG: hypothetical protein ABIA63_13550 [bacterium]
MNFKKCLLYVTLVNICIGFFEGAIVIYLRKIYYPYGFEFPLNIAGGDIVVVELMREAISIVLLWGIGSLAGKSFNTRFAWFAYSFGVWDIVYYIVLKGFLGWPRSLLTWDILFLLPLPWIGPVLAPVLVSIGLITCGLIIIYLEEKGLFLRLTRQWWAGQIICGLVIIYTFIENYKIVLDKEAPVSFSWGLFLIALGSGIIIFILALKFLGEQVSR